MARIGEQDPVEVKIRQLERRVQSLLAVVEGQDRMLRQTLLKDGERPWEGPFTHNGSLFGVFGKSPASQAATPGSLSDVVAVLQRFGFVA